MRVQENEVIILDHSSLVIGNKYESWARFLNFMILFSRDLDKILSTHILTERGEEEFTMLQVMRVYKMMQLIHFYAKSVSKTEGDLLVITLNRLEMWSNNMLDIINGDEISKNRINEHLDILDKNRSTEEKLRHKDITG
jgi:hypothetical protein